MDKLNNPPHGSTHYLQNGDQTHYYKVSENSVCFYARSGKWIETEIQAQNLPNCIIEIPKQQADDDLTWLARNVHQWPEESMSCNVKIGKAWHGNEDDPDTNARYEVHLVDDSGSFTKDQWLTRRAELQNKPDWEDAPEWANWLGQCPSGKWEWYGDEEEFHHHKDMDYWDNQSLGEGSGKMGEVLGDWRDTIERRPQAAKSKPATEPFSDDWHKRGELPPAGEICVLHAKENNGEKVMFIGITSDSFPVFETFEKRVFVERGEYSFSPIQTERERVASELVDVMLAVPVSDRKTASESYMSMALAIYDHLHPESKS